MHNAIISGLSDKYDVARQMLDLKGCVTRVMLYIRCQRDKRDFCQKRKSLGALPWWCPTEDPIGPEIPAVQNDRSLRQTVLCKRQSARTTDGVQQQI